MATNRLNSLPDFLLQEYPAGKVIVNQGDLPEHLFFVAKGIIYEDRLK